MAAERGHWSSLTALQKTALVLGIPAGATVLYILYRRYRESREERLTFVGDKELEIEMRVPRAAMKSIIGRKGATIKKLSQETGARITVEEEEGEEETALLIAGSPAQVCRAKAAVHHIVTESTPVTEQLCVPQRAVGRIIGRGGETVRGICRSSGARVLCEREADAGPGPIRVVQLSGTRAEVAAAKKLILEKVTEDVAFHKELVVAAARCPGKQPLGRRRDREPLPDGEEEDEGATSRAEGSELHQDEDEELEVPKFEGVTSSACPSKPSSAAWPGSSLLSLDVATELVRLGHAVPCPQEGPGGDGTPQPVPGAAAETPEPVTATSLESLLLEPQHSPSETPRTPSCLSLSDGVSGGSEDGDGVVTEMRSS